MKLPLRIAILECDTPLDNTRAKYGGYGGVFKQMLERGANALQHDGLSAEEGLLLKIFNIVEKQDVYPALEDIDAILMTGSRYNAFDDTPWITKLVDFTKMVLKQDRVRIIGVCFGHQIVGRAMGQKVDRGGEWEVSVTPVELVGKGKELFKVDSLNLWQMHRDIVYGFPEGVEQLAETAVCQNQGMYCKNRMITVQGHPEFTRDIEEEILKSRVATGIISEAVYKDGMQRLPDHDDGIIVAQAFLRFLLED